jgi:hypothetical protein
MNCTVFYQCGMLAKVQPPDEVAQRSIRGIPQRAIWIPAKTFDFPSIVP